MLKRLLLAALIVAAAFAAWPGNPWNREPNPIPQFEALVAGLETNVVPPGATCLNRSEITRRDLSLETSWQFDTEHTWHEYRQWVQDGLPGGFRAVPPATAPVAFTRTDPGDAHYLTVELVSPGPPTRIRATLRAGAD